MFVMGMHCLGNASLSKVPKWVDIVSTVQSGAEPGRTESKHTCNAKIECAQAWSVLKIIGSSD
jgi:hypothetical protein